MVERLEDLAALQPRARLLAQQLAIRLHGGDALPGEQRAVAAVFQELGELAPIPGLLDERAEGGAIVLAEPVGRIELLELVAQGLDLLLAADLVMAHDG